MYYIGTNLGAFLAPLLIGSLAQNQGRHWDFAAAGVAMASALMVYVLASRHHNLRNDQAARTLRSTQMEPLLRRPVPMVLSTAGLVLLHGELRGFGAEGLAFDLFVLIQVVAVLE